MSNLLTPDLSDEVFRNLKRVSEGSFDSEISGEQNFKIRSPLSESVDLVPEWTLLWFENNNLVLALENFKIICNMFVNENRIKSKIVSRALKLLKIEDRQDAVDYLVVLLFRVFLKTNTLAFLDKLDSSFGQLMKMAFDYDPSIKSTDTYQITNRNIELRFNVNQLKRLQELKLKIESNDPDT